MIEKEKINKTGKIVYYVFLGFISLAALLLVISVFPITGNIKFLVVQSGSMEPTIKTGSVVLVKPLSDYKVGDIITFGPITETLPSTTHRIFSIEKQDGRIVYITKVDANNGPDLKPTEKKDIIGKVFVAIPYFGYVVNFSRTPLGFLVIILAPAAIIIFDEIKNIKNEMTNISKNKKLQQLKNINNGEKNE